MTVPLDKAFVLHADCFMLWDHERRATHPAS
jgi:hypothetical protein